MADVIDAWCIACPDGQTRWCKDDPKDAATTWAQWRNGLPAAQREAYEQAGVLGGIVKIRMLRADFDRLTSGVLGTAATIATGANDDPRTAIRSGPGAAGSQLGDGRLRDEASDGSRHGAGGRDERSGEQPGSPAIQGDRRGRVRTSEAAEVLDLLPRIDAAIQRIASGRMPMRVPAEDTDPDLVLADCKRLLAHVYGVTVADAQTFAPHTPMEGSKP